MLLTSISQFGEHNEGGDQIADWFICSFFPWQKESGEENAGRHVNDVVWGNNIDCEWMCVMLV